MPLPNPTLTHVQGSLVTISSTSPVDVIAAIKTAINALSGAQNWTADDADSVDTTNNPGLLISAPVGGEIPNFRAIVGFATTIPARHAAPQCLTAVDSNVTTGQMSIGIGPNGKDGLANWYDTDPLGSFRFSKLMRCLPATTGSKVWCVASEETLWVFVLGASDSAIGGFGVGALIEPYALGGDAESDERIYGMMALGTTMATVQGSLHTVDSQTVFGGGTPGANSTAPRFQALNPGLGSSRSCRLRRFATTTTMATGNTTWNLPSSKPVLDWGAIPVFKSDGSQIIGRMRGMGWYGNMICRQVLRDDGVDKAIVLSSSLSGAGHSVIFRAG